MIDHEEGRKSELGTELELVQVRGSCIPAAKIWAEFLSRQENGSLRQWHLCGENTFRCYN